MFKQHPQIIPELAIQEMDIAPELATLSGPPVMPLVSHPLVGWPAIYKRLFDIAGALFALAALALPMALIALAIKLHDGGPVFYRQRRVSLGHRAFRMIKFRTMVPNAETDGPQFAARNDPRCTPLGRYLRATSLDELPQLLNILTGDMSLVGPRPERPEILVAIEQEIPAFPLRLQVRPGLTGWAQVNGHRGGGGGTCFRARLQYDLYYLQNWSPLLDFRILLATIMRGFHNNAY